MQDMRVTMTIGSHPELQGLSAFIQSSQLRPLLTWLNSPQPITQSHPSHPDVPETYHSKKRSAGA